MNWRPHWWGLGGAEANAHFLAPPTAAEQTLSRVIGVTGEAADEQQTHRAAPSGERPRQDRRPEDLATHRRRPRVGVGSSLRYTGGEPAPRRRCLRRGSRATR